MKDTVMVLVEFIDGTSKSIEATPDIKDSAYGYLPNELFYVNQESDSRAFFPREFVKAISIIKE